MKNKIILGSANFDQTYGIKKNFIKKNEIKKLFNLALKNKIKTIDTSPLYNKSEKIIGLLNNNRFKIISKIPKPPKNIKRENIRKWLKQKVMTDFCKIFKIKYKKCLEKTTFLGLQWWGDKISKNWISGVNKNFKINIDKNLFFERDIIFFESLAEDIIKFYKYNFTFDGINKIYFNFLPMKCELLVWKNTFKHKRIKHILSIPYFYLKRILLINKFVITNKHLPYSIGSNRSFRRIA